MLLASLAVFGLLAQQGSGPKPTCQHCPATYIPKSELDAYTAKAIKYNLVDQQVRSIDIGKVQVGIGMVTRGKLAAPAGTGHLFTEIPDHITYMMVRLDPDKVVPTKSEAESAADLKVIPPSRKGAK